MQTIDISGPQGNAFFLLGTARKLAKQLKLNGEEIHEEMTNGDYDHLTATFEKYFGDYVQLVDGNDYQEDESDWGSDEHGPI